MALGDQKQVWRPLCSNLMSFGSKSSVEESTCDIVRIFVAPRSDSAPVELRPPTPLVTPLFGTIIAERLRGSFQVT